MMTVDGAGSHVDGAEDPVHTRRKRGQRQKVSASSQLHYVAVREILDDVVCLAPLEATTSGRAGVRADAAVRRRDYRAVLAVSSVNYALKSEGEQEAITASYQAFLNGLAFPVQVLVRVVPLDLGPYLARLEKAVGQDEATNATGWETPIPRLEICLHLVAPDPKRPDDSADTGSGGAPGPKVESVWAALARDHVRFVRDLAARHTLLERRFYLIVPADGETTRSAHSRGRRMAAGGGRLPQWLPGHRPRMRRAAAEQLAAVRQQLDLRTSELIRQLGRISLEARRLRGAELVALYVSCLSPGRAAQHPLPLAVVNGVGQPVSRGFLPVALKEHATARARVPAPAIQEGRTLA